MCTNGRFDAICSNDYVGLSYRPILELDRDAVAVRSVGDAAVMEVSDIRREKFDKFIKQVRAVDEPFGGAWASNLFNAVSHFE